MFFMTGIVPGNYILKINMNARVKYKKLPLTEDTGTFQKKRKICLDRLKSTVPCFAFLNLPFIRWIDVLQPFEKTDQSM